MKNVLITGAAGYIGSTLSRQLAECGYSVTCLDNFKYNQYCLLTTTFNHPNIQFFNRDVNSGILNNNLLKYFDVIIPLAALVGAPLCKEKPELSYDTNVNQIKKILSAVSPDQLIIYPNSTSSYGSSDTLINEDTPRLGVTEYAKQKDEGEELIKANHSNYTIFRLATVFGISPRMRIDLLVNNLVYRCLFDRKLMIFDGHFKRNFVHVKDVCNAFQRAIEHPSKMKNQVFNVGNEDLNSTKLALASKIAEFYNVNITEGEGKDEDQRNAEISSQKLLNTGFQYRNSLIMGMSELNKLYNKFPLNKEIREEMVKNWRNY